jgi:hypothetical protein
MDMSGGVEDLKGYTTIHGIRQTVHHEIAAVMLGLISMSST